MTCAVHDREAKSGRRVKRIGERAGGGNDMPSELDTNNIKKAMAYDLQKILEKAQNAGQEQYSIREIIDLIDNYITASTSKS